MHGLLLCHILQSGSCVWAQWPQRRSCGLALAHQATVSDIVTPTISGLPGHSFVFEDAIPSAVLLHHCVYGNMSVLRCSPHGIARMSMPRVDCHCAKSIRGSNRCVNQMHSDNTPCNGYEAATSRWTLLMETVSMKEAGQLCFVCWPNDPGRHAFFNMWSQRSRSCRIVRGVVTFICPYFAFDTFVPVLI